MASPHANYDRRGEQGDAHYFRKLVEEEEIRLFVVGLAVHGNGAESQQSQAARKFGGWLAKTTGVPVEYYDERYSSAEADKWLELAEFTKKQRKARRDMLAAQILLSAYLERGGRGDGTEALDD